MNLLAPDRDPAPDFITAARRFLMVFLTVAALMILSFVPLHLPGLGAIRPPLLLIAVYYWAITRPSALPPPAAFILGLVFDLVATWPLGVSALIFLSVKALVRHQRRFLLGQSFVVVWTCYFFICLAASLAQWAIFCLFELKAADLRPVLVAALLSALLFPLLVPLLAFVNRALADTGAGK